MQDAGAATPDFNRVPDRESPEMAWWRASMATKDARLDWKNEAHCAEKSVLRQLAPAPRF